MQRYRHAPLLPLGLGLLVIGGCSVPSQRENIDATARLVVGRVSAPLLWRLDPKADAAARERVETLLADGMSLEEAIEVAFLASPELQLEFEKLEISRSELVAATAISNPVLVGGARQPQGDLAAFYPDRTISFGVVQSLIGLLTIPGRRGVAKHDLERARYEAARSAVQLAAQVAQAWIDYSAEQQKQELCERAVAVARKAYDNQLAAEPGASTGATRDELLSRQRDAFRGQLGVTKARAELEELLGIAGWRDDWRVLQTLPQMPATDPDPVVQEKAAMDRRLDLLAANQAIEARLRLLAHKRRFRWLSQLDIGLFRDQVVGGTSFTGPNAALELPLFDQQQAQLLNADSELRSELRRRESTRLTARKEIRSAAAEILATRQLLEQVEGQILPALRQQQADPAGGDPDDAEVQARRLANMDTEVHTLSGLP
jgi:outer membrane protein, heavy metal efflux system